MKLKYLTPVLASAVALAAFAPTPVIAEDSPLLIAARGGNKPDKPGNGGGEDPAPSTPTYYSWMHADIQSAWSDGYLGQNVTVTVVDDFNSRTKLFGNLGEGLKRKRHGEWTSAQISMLTPSATMVSHEFTSGAGFALGDGFNVINASYGWVEFPAAFGGLDAQEISVVDYAFDGSAFVSKSAGNESVAIGDVIASGTYAGQIDYLATNLIGAPSAVFVGALDGHGTAANKASLASYSNYAGTNATVQGQFLVVGVESGTTGLAGTSFAAPMVASYAAVLSNKFSGATPTAIANQLLTTARTDTILGYNPAIHGQGEASLSNALAPVSIN